jgi:hypothetical protein
MMLDGLYFDLVVLELFLSLGTSHFFVHETAELNQNLCAIC